ncbi:MAG: hypothetical protein Ta2B_10010 [Termitinemataceae bacterium]|nr:MAG: hypothetical protein Ta2B_10010 [Termitinemataceae bacterium]
MLSGQSFGDAVKNTFTDTNSLLTIAGSTALGAITSGASSVAAKGVTTTGKVLSKANKIKTGENVVYQSFNASGKVNYVGITNNFERRAAEHLSKKSIEISKIPGLGNLSRSDARAIEQVLIEHHGLGEGSSLLNKINSIAETNPIYAKALERGSELLKQIGYEGF